MTVEITTLPSPTQCVLWEKPKLVDSPLKQNFELLETYADESHLGRHLLKCRECGQLYFFEFYEIVDWKGGNDPQYTTYIPVESKARGEELSRKNVFELMTYYPRLQCGWPADGPKSPFAWNGK